MRNINLPDSFLVLSSVKNSPTELTGVGLIVVKSGIFAGEQADDFTVGLAVVHSMARMDFETTKVAELSSHVRNEI